MLLVNPDAILPLDPTRLARLAVVGPWAGKAAVGGGGSSMVNPIRQITPLEGIDARLAGSGVELLGDSSGDAAAAARLAAAADVAVVVVGDFETEGARARRLFDPRRHVLR